MNSDDDEIKKVAELWEKYHASKEVEYRDALIVHYLDLVKAVALKMASGLPSHIKQEDLYSSGITGLVRAVEKFDRAKGSKFESYAILLIKGAIIDELRALDWIPRTIHQKASAIAKAEHDLHQNLGRQPEDWEIAQQLGLTQKEFEELLQRVRPAIFIPLNANFFQDGESAPLCELIEDKKALTSLEIAKRKEFSKLIEKALDRLSEQEQKVLTLYYYEEKMLKQIGEILGVSESRVCQIHTKALLKLRNELSNQL